MSNSKILELIKEKKREIDEIIDSMTNVISGSFKDICKEVIFDRYPDVESFTWAQYTPYFNDGDECIFAANSQYASVNVNDTQIYDQPYINDTILNMYKLIWDSDKKERITNPNYDTRFDVYYDIEALLTDIGDDFLLRCFGDHVEITVSREGIETKEYQHD